MLQLQIAVVTLALCSRLTTQVLKTKFQRPRGAHWMAGRLSLRKLNLLTVAAWLPPCQRPSIRRTTDDLINLGPVTVPIPSRVSDC